LLFEPLHEVYFFSITTTPQKNKNKIIKVKKGEIGDDSQILLFSIIDVNKTNK